MCRSIPLAISPDGRGTLLSIPQLRYILHIMGGHGQELEYDARVCQYIYTRGSLEGRNSRRETSVPVRVGRRDEVKRIELNERAPRSVPYGPCRMVRGDLVQFDPPHPRLARQLEALDVAVRSVGDCLI